MKKGDSVAFCPGAGALVYQFDTVVFQKSHLAFEVVGFEADVMEPGTMLGQEPSDGRVLRGWADQLDFGVPAKLHKSDFDFLVLDPMAIDDFASHHIAVKVTSAVEVRNSDGDVGDVFEHWDP